MKRVRFIKSWQTYCVGDVITPFSNMAYHLVAAKLCVYEPERKTLKLNKKNKNVS